MLGAVKFFSLLLSLGLLFASGEVAATAYRVQAGDTLWSIAASSYGGDPREGVWKLRERNRLAGTTIAPGQLLRLP